jgi:regulator of replication initiation timing
MTDIQKLKALAEHHRSLGHAYTVATPAAVLELINERSIAILQLDIQRDIAARRHEKIEKLKAENERLELENEDTLKKLEEAVEGFTKLSAEVLDLRQQLAVPSDVLADCEALRLENEALRKDAERYRWLRQDDVVQYEISTKCSEEKMDAAIDAAMSKEASHD